MPRPPKVQYVVRKATLKDLPQLERLANLHQVTDSFPLKLRNRINLFKKPDTNYLVSVASIDQKLVGVYFTMRHTLTNNGIGDGIFVDPEHRKTGVSDALFLHAISVLKSRGAEEYSATGSTTLGKKFLDRVTGETKKELGAHAFLISDLNLEEKLEEFKKNNPHITFKL